MRAWYAEHGDAWERAHAARHPGLRSWAWWRFVAGEHRPRGEDEVARLLELDALNESEADALVAAGRAEREAQLAGQVCHIDVPASVRDANAVLRHRGAPLIDADVFDCRTPAWRTALKAVKTTASRDR
jgi:hypothetical protein